MVSVFCCFRYSAAGPLLALKGLEMVDVPTAAVLQRIESLEFLLMARLFMGEEVTRWTLANAGLTAAGVLLALLSPPLFGARLEFGQGSVLILLAGLCYSSSLVISKRFLSPVPVGIVSRSASP